METATAPPDERIEEPTGAEETPAQDPDGLPEDGYAGDLILEGSGQLSMSVGGKRPTTSTITLVGGALELDGQFDKAERIVLHLECEVAEVAFVDQHDPKTKQVVGCRRSHKARITGVERV